MVAAGRHEVLNVGQNVDKLTYSANPDRLRQVSSLPNYRFERIDTCDAPAIRQAIAEFDPDGFIHLAAETHVDRSIDGPGSFVTTNVLGPSVLLQAATGHWQDLPQARGRAFRFVHVSTDEVFGSLGPTGHFTETTPYAPNSPSKASSDMLVRSLVP